MYDFVKEDEVRIYRQRCSGILLETRRILKEKGITAEILLIGSGHRNMVMRNGNGPFDLDYNLNIVRAEQIFWDNPRLLREYVRNALDQANSGMPFGLQVLSFAHNSTSALTVVATAQGIQTFSFDVGIVTCDRDGTWERLVFDKKAPCNPCGQYVWNKVPYSRNLQWKVDAIKDVGGDKWDRVRQYYKDLKNRGLIEQEKQPSFVIFARAVFDVYNALRQQGFIR